MGLESWCRRLFVAFLSGTAFFLEAMFPTSMPSAGVYFRRHQCRAQAKRVDVRQESFLPLYHALVAESRAACARCCSSFASVISAVVGGLHAYHFRHVSMLIVELSWQWAQS